MNNELSKEEILDKHLEDSWDRTCEDNLHELEQAMEEYAGAKAKKETIAFGNWCGRNYERYATAWIKRGKLIINPNVSKDDIFSTEQLYDSKEFKEYLKQNL